MDTSDEIMRALTEQHAARVTVLDAAYQEDLAAVREEMRPRAELTRRQLAALEAEQSEAVGYADKIAGLVRQIEADGHRGPAQQLADWASDLRAPFLGNARGGFAGSIAPLVESRKSLTLYDSDAAFTAHFSLAVLADVYLRRETITRFREALGRVDGCLGDVQKRRGQIKTLLQTISVADPVAPRRS